MKRRPRERSHLDRTRARAWAVQVLYQWDLAGRDSEIAVLDQILGSRRVGESRVPYLRKLIEEFRAHRSDIDERVEAALDNWRMERLAAVDRAILRVAATELIRMRDVPKGVAIHEAVLLAERYSGNDSPPFVNGVLEALVRALPALESSQT